MVTSTTQGRRPSRLVTSTDGVQLAVYETGDPGRPTALLIHGYPDNHAVWDGIVGQLCERFRVVTYDVRGAGRSGRPTATSAYRIAQLVEDLAAVLDAVAPEEAVHLLAHDWGSIQTWDALGDPRFAGRIASFTSVSGPSLDMASVWLRGVRKHPRAVLGQVLSSSYMPILQLPFLPELLARAGVIARGVAVSSTHGTTADSLPHPVFAADARDGIKLYRANFARRIIAPAPVRTSVPVQVLAPIDDLHVSVPCQMQAPEAFVTSLRTREIEGNHWIITQRPDLVASSFVSFVDSIEAEEHPIVPFARVDEPSRSVAALRASDYGE